MKNFQHSSDTREVGENSSEDTSNLQSLDSLHQSQAHYHQRQPVPYTSPQPLNHQPVPYTSPQPLQHQPVPYTSSQPLQHQPVPYTSSQPLQHQPVPYTSSQPLQHQPVPDTSSQPLQHQPHSYSQTQLQQQPLLVATMPELQKLMTQHTSSVREDIAELRTQVTELRAEVVELRAEVAELRKNGEQPKRSHLYSLPEGFPLKTMEEFKTFEEGDISRHDDLQRHLEYLGGHNLKECIAAYLKCIMSKELAQNFNWTGKTGTESVPLYNSTLMRVCFDAINNLPTFKSNRISLDEFKEAVTNALKSYKQNGKKKSQTAEGVRNTMRQLERENFRET